MLILAALLAFILALILLRDDVCARFSCGSIYHDRTAGA